MGIFPIVDDLELPRPLRALHPLSSHQRGQTEILFAELDMHHHGVQVGLDQSLFLTMRLLSRIGIACWDILLKWDPNFIARQ